MTRDASQIPNNPRKQICPAMWLLFLLARRTPAEWTGEGAAWVAGGNVVSDAELADRLEVSASVIAAWRLRLRRLGLVGWLVSPGKGRAFWVAGVNQAFAGGGEKPAKQGTEKQPASGPVPAIWRVIEERSIALTGKVVEDLTVAEGAQLAKVLTGSEIVRETEPE